MCANCKFAGKQFISSYSGKEMTVCTKTGKGQFSFQGCEDWERYEKVIC